MIDNTLTPEQKANVKLYVCATDKFMSGWGQAPNRSLYCVACETEEQAVDVYNRMKCRTDMKRVRITKNPSRAHKEDHLKIVWHTEFTYQPDDR